LKHNWDILPLAICILLATGKCTAQTQTQLPEPAVNVVSGTITAMGYPVGGGSTRVNLVGTAIATQASGTARVDAKSGGTQIDLRVSDMPQPTTLGGEFLTYVLWTVTPDGTTTNLGEIPFNQNGNGRLSVRAQSQTFALIVTAEPYFAVRMPSELVVLENKITSGQIYPDNSYKLMKRSEYTRGGNPLALAPDLRRVPLDLYEARNAVEIAKLRGAEEFAPQIFAQAQTNLQMAENALSQNSGKNDILSAARQTIQFAEDARARTAQIQKAQRIESEKEAAAARARAEAEAQAAAEAKRQAELTAAKEAQMKAQAAAAAAEQRAAAEAAAAQAAVAAAQQKAAADAAAAQAAAEQAALQAKADAAQAATVALRAQLLKQLNEVLQTTDTPRGLVVNMADVLFETGKYELSMDAKLKLAKLSGIIQAHPGLNLAIEGYTDTTGTPQRNMILSQQRADAVRQFLLTQGLQPGNVSSKGMGQSNPIADNSTAAGRQLNRRVEIIISGQVIGVNIGK
jgi:outer membrane protein OmpA-like peptidoglycan-associated protein